MRITNKIIQNNSLTNINGNKILQDKLSTQIATEKKISRPSDDPIIALRSLRLRTSVSQTEQFREKNAEDAESWLDVTEDAINTLSEIITDIRKQYVKGTSDTLTASDRRIILENLESLAAEIYNTGNVDFAGRSLFTGFRTDTSLTFEKNEEVDFTIWEEGNTDALDTIRYTHQDDASEQGVYREEITRFRLSYNALKEGSVAKLTFTNEAGTAPTVPGATAGTDSSALNAETVSSADSPSPYELITTPGNEDKVYFVRDTGEILFGSNVADAIKNDSLSFSVEYERNEWVKGDLRPQHYFKCLDKGADPVIEYNYDSSPEAEICYNIGVNQSLRINTNASECFTHNIKRDIDDIIRALNEVDEVEEKLTRLKADYAAAPENSALRDSLQAQIDAVSKSHTFVKDNLSKLFGSGITCAEGYLKRNNLALTNCGTRSKRLELIQNRLDTQLSTLKELKSENEDVDMAETAVKLSSAEYAYDAALMSTSKILQQSLLNYL